MLKIGSSEVDFENLADKELIVVLSCGDCAAKVAESCETRTMQEEEVWLLIA